MSGGAFDYAYRRVEDFADDLTDWTGKAESIDSSAEVEAALYAICADARRTAALMRAAEWLASGDYGEEDFLAAVAEARGGT